MGQKTCDIERKGKAKTMSRVFGVSYGSYYCKTHDDHYESPDAWEQEECPLARLRRRKEADDDAA